MEQVQAVKTAFTTSLCHMCVYNHTDWARYLALACGYDDPSSCTSIIKQRLAILSSHCCCNTGASLHTRDTGKHNMRHSWKIHYVVTDPYCGDQSRRPRYVDTYLTKLYNAVPQVAPGWPSGYSNESFMPSLNSLSSLTTSAGGGHAASAPTAAAAPPASPPAAAAPPPAASAALAPADAATALGNGLTISTSVSLGSTPSKPRNIPESTALYPDTCSCSN